MNRIVWLASYPKSGNTWFRIFLTNYLRDADQPANINQLDNGPIASSRFAFDQAVGYDSGELTFDETDSLRPEAYLHWARRATETLYCKVHDAYTFLPDGRALFPAEATACALYFVRNPLDVAVSFAHHGGHQNFDQTIKMMANPDYSFCAQDHTELNQLRQRLLSWSAHYRSWRVAADTRVHVVRYEDMKGDPESTFGQIIRFAGLPEDHQRLLKALAFSEFDAIKRQETQNGFFERPSTKRIFFRKGVAGSWRESLTAEQADRIIADHHEVMTELGYLDPAGKPVF